MPFNYLSTVIIIEPDTQPEERERERETEGQREPNGKRKGATTKGGTSKISHVEKSHYMELKMSLF